MATHQERFSVCLQEVKIVTIKNQLKEEGLSDGRSSPQRPARPVPPRLPPSQVRQSLIIPNRSEEFQKNQSALARNFVPKRGINGGGAIGIGMNGEDLGNKYAQEEPNLPTKQEEKTIKKFATLRPKKRIVSTVTGSPGAAPKNPSQLTKLPPAKLPELPPDAQTPKKKPPKPNLQTQSTTPSPSNSPNTPDSPNPTPENANPALKSRSHIVAMMKKNQRDSLHSSSPNIPLYFAGSLPNSSSPPAASRTTSMYNKGTKVHSNSDPLQHLNLISNINHQIKSSQSHREPSSVHKTDEKLVKLTLQSDTEGIGEFESQNYLQNQSKNQLIAVIFIPKHLMRKTFRLTLDQTVADLIEMATRNLNDGEYHVYFPRTSIWLSSSRQLFSYCLFEKEEFELIQRPSLSLRVVKVRIEVPGAQECEELVPYSSLTKVYGILQCLKRKHIENISKFTLYNPDSVALDPLRTLSSYNNIQMLYYREKSEDTRISQSKGRVLLKILLVEASGSKLIKFDRTSTVNEAISRILLSYKVEAHHIPLYRLFIPLGAPLELSDTLEQLQLQDYDPLEFKKLPPHLLQLIDLKPSPPPVPSRNSVSSRHPVSHERSPQQRENANTINSHIPITEWTVNDVTKWLEEIGYGELAPDFVQRSITGESLFSLDKDNLRDQLNIQALGIRKALLREIRKLAVRSQIGAQKELGESNTARGSMNGPGGARGPTPSTMQRPTVTSTIRKQLVLAPTLALRDTYEVEERDVVNLSFEIVCMLLKKLDDLQAWTLEGIFRVSGIKATVERCYSSLRNALPNFNGADAHDVASAFKHYLRSLEDPLIPAKAYADFIASFSESEIKQEVLKAAIDALPFENYKSLKVLVEFCVKIADNENVNMMGSRNLGIVFGPTVLRNRDPYVDFSNAAAHAQVFKTMVDDCRTLFD